MKHAYKAWSRAALIVAAVPLAACAEAEDGGGAWTDGGAGSAGAGATAGGGGAGGGSGAGGGGAAGDAGSAGGGGMGGLVDGGPPISVSGYVVELALSQATDKPVPNMKVCVYGVPSVPCVTTNSIGYYQVQGVPGGNEILLEFTKDTFFPVLRTVTTGSTDIELGSIPYPTVALANLFGTLVNTKIDTSKGQVLAMALKTVILPDGGTGFTGQEDVSAAMTPKSGQGPFYTTASSVPDPAATATSTNGVGLFANVEPGDVEIEMSHPTKSCTRYVEGAWQGSTSTASRVPVIPGYIIGGAVLQCPP
jgi:hypothetical protein